MSNLSEHASAGSTVHVKLEIYAVQNAIRWQPSAAEIVFLCAPAIT